MDKRKNREEWGSVTNSVLMGKKQQYNKVWSLRMLIWRRWELCRYREEKYPTKSKEPMLCWDQCVFNIFWEPEGSHCSGAGKQEVD